MFIIGLVSAGLAHCLRQVMVTFCGINRYSRVGHNMSGPLLGGGGDGGGPPPVRQPPALRSRHAPWPNPS